MKVSRAVWFLALAASIGCHQHEVWFQAPEGVRTADVKMFGNATLYREVGIEFAQALRKEILRKTNLSLTASQAADAYFAGTVVRYRPSVLREDRFDRVTEFQLKITVDWRFVNARTGKTIKSGTTAWDDEYRLRRGETEVFARQRVLRDLAREVIAESLEPWEPKDAKPEPAAAVNRTAKRSS